MSLRTRAISLLDKAGAIELAMVARKFVKFPFLPIVTYHRIGDPKRIARELDEGVVDATTETFERHVELLMRRFTLIGLDELRLHFSEGRPLPKNAALMTFDDGYRECHDVVLPIFERVGAKGVFFISTDHMNDRKAFWWDRVSYLVKRSTKTRVEIDYPKHAVYDDLTSNRTKVTTCLLDVIKETYALDVELYLQGLSVALDVPWGPAEEHRITSEVLMTWDEVRAMRRAGMDIGSHTRSHRVLQTLTPDHLRDELGGSRRMLEEKLDEPIRSIAYPVGLSVAQDLAILGALRDAGYELGFSATGGVGRLGANTNPFDIQRLWVDPSFSHAYFRASLAVPHLTTYRR